jgi:HEAT repeat protein
MSIDHVIRRLTEEDVDSLVELLRKRDSSNLDERMAAAYCLGHLGRADGLSALESALAEDERPVRQMAAKALGQFVRRSNRARASLLSALDDDSWAVRAEAVESLGKLGKQAEPAVIDAVKNRLHDQDNWVRMAAVESLGKFGDPSAVEPLLAAARDRNLLLRSAAVSALRSLRPVANERLKALLLERPWRDRRVIRRVLRRHDIHELIALSLAIGGTLEAVDSLLDWEGFVILEALDRAAICALILGVVRLAGIAWRRLRRRPKQARY